jgi:DNA-binding NarL/FixJ family response regulator
MEKQQILIYEDDKQYREGLVWLIASDIRLEVVGVFPNADNIKSDVTALKPDIVLVDLHMPPGITGIEAIRQVRQNGSSLPILVLTGLDDEDIVIDAIQVGANGYIVKTRPIKELLEAIFIVLEGGAPMSPNVAVKVLDFIKTNHNKNKIDLVVNLTKRENEILYYLTQGKSHKMIASILNIEVITVRNHLRHIYEKLQVHSATEAVSIALKHGLVMDVKR